MSHRKAYPSDLTDAEWEKWEPLIPAVAEDAPNVQHTRREIVNGILYVLRSGCPWRLVPHDLPAWQTLYDYLRSWERAGIWEKAMHALRKELREKEGRDPEPSAGVIDSQSIKTSAVRGKEKGLDMGKLIWGRKRHLLVDSGGNLMAVKVTGAEVTDLAGGKRLLRPLLGRFPRMQLLWGDSHYGGQLKEWIKVYLGWDVQTVRGLGTVPDADPSPSEPASKPAKKGFHVLPRRWVVERSIAWITRWRRLCRDHEGLPSTSETFITISASRRMLSRLAA
jgi:putative transposase